MSRPPWWYASEMLPLAWGATLIARPTEAAAAVAGPLSPPIWIVRVLGARYVMQQVVVLAVPTPLVARVTAGVDALHAMSMLAAAALERRYRRAEVTSAAVAATFALMTLATERRSAQRRLS